MKPVSSSASVPEASERIRTLVRIRPLQDSESGQAEALEVLSPQKAEIWRAVQTCVDKVVEGVSATIFAHGQTGTGKTHTMLGPEVTRLCGCSDLKLQEASVHARAHMVKRRLQLASQVIPCLEESEALGVIPRACSRIFELLRERKAECASQVRVFASYVQIYNEKLVDLLAGLQIFEVQSAEELLLLLLRGTLHRAFRSTRRNHMSSRSHAVFQVELRHSVKGARSLMWKSRLNLVDLAGNERCDPRVALSKPHLEEMGSINRSLSALILCIQQLNKAGSTVSFRSSSLTRLLQNSLGGSCHTVFICTVSPSTLCTRETLATLRLAIRAKNVKTTPKPSPPASKEQIEQLQREVRLLRGIVTTQNEAAEMRLSGSWQRLEKRLFECAVSLRVREEVASSKAQLAAIQSLSGSTQIASSQNPEECLASALLAVSAFKEPHILRRSVSCPSSTCITPFSLQAKSHLDDASFFGQLKETANAPNALLRPERSHLAEPTGNCIIEVQDGEDRRKEDGQDRPRDKKEHFEDAEDDAPLKKSISPREKKERFPKADSCSPGQRYPLEAGVSAEASFVCTDTTETQSAEDASASRGSSDWRPENSTDFPSEVEDYGGNTTSCRKVCRCDAPLSALFCNPAGLGPHQGRGRGEQNKDRDEVSQDLREGLCADEEEIREKSLASASSDVCLLEGEKELPRVEGDIGVEDLTGLDEKTVLHALLQTQRLQALQQRRLASRMRQLEKLHAVAQVQKTNLPSECERPPPAPSLAQTTLPTSPTSIISPTSHDAFQAEARRALRQLRAEKEVLAQHHRSLEAKLQLTKPSLEYNNGLLAKTASLAQRPSPAQSANVSSIQRLCFRQSRSTAKESPLRRTPSLPRGSTNNWPVPLASSPPVLPQWSVCADTRSGASHFLRSSSEATRAAAVGSSSLRSDGVRAEAYLRSTFNSGVSEEVSRCGSVWIQPLSALGVQTPQRRAVFEGAADLQCLATPGEEAAFSRKGTAESEITFAMSPSAERCVGDSSPPNLSNGVSSTSHFKVWGGATAQSRRMSLSSFKPHAAAPPLGWQVYSQLPKKEEFLRQKVALQPISPVAPLGAPCLVSLR